MITWNIDLTNYTQEQLEELLSIVEKMDSSIAKEIEDYLVNTYSTQHGNINNKIGTIEQMDN